MNYKDMNLILFADALAYQRQLFEESLQRKLNKLEVMNTLLFCEHPHTVTIGRNGEETNLLYSEQYLKDRGIDFYHTDRGGDITYHGPGQLVGYPIFDIESYGIGIKQYIYNLEEVVIRLLSTFGIYAQRLSNSSGVWIDVDSHHSIRKICAIGVRCSRYITMHGFALNVNTDLSYFSLINPCGFTDKGVTSMARELNTRIDIEEVKKRGLNIFEDIFCEI